MFTSFFVLHGLGEVVIGEDQFAAPERLGRELMNEEVAAYEVLQEALRQERQQVPLSPGEAGEAELRQAAGGPVGEAEELEPREGAGRLELVRPRTARGEASAEELVDEAGPVGQADSEPEEWAQAGQGSGLVQGEQGLAGQVGRADPELGRQQAAAAEEDSEEEEEGRCCCAEAGGEGERGDSSHPRTRLPDGKFHFSSSCSSR